MQTNVASAANKIFTFESPISISTGPKLITVVFGIVQVICLFFKVQKYHVNM